MDTNCYIHCFIHGSACPYNAKCNNSYRSKGQMRPFGRVIRRHKRAQKKSNKLDIPVHVPDEYGYPTSHQCFPTAWNIDPNVCPICFCAPNMQQECFCGFLNKTMK